LNSTSSSETQKDIVAKKSSLRENAEAILVAIVLALFIRTFIIQAFKIPSGSMLETLQIGDHILVNKFVYGVKLPFSNKTIIPFKSPQRGDIIVFEFPIDPDKDFIKRVIGLPGDVIEIRNKDVRVNHERFELPQAIHKDGKSRGQDSVPYRLTENSLQDIEKKGVPETIIRKLIPLKEREYANIDKFMNDVVANIGNEDFINYNSLILTSALIGEPRDNYGPVTVPAGTLFVMGDNRDHSYDSRYWGFVNLNAVKGKAFIIYWSWDSPNFGVRWKRLAKILH
jgi:signal peptidase I